MGILEALEIGGLGTLGVALFGLLLLGVDALTRRRPDDARVVGRHREQR